MPNPDPANPAPALDPAIDAIREVRSQISKSVDHDLEKLVRRYRILQEQHSDRILCKPTKTTTVQKI